MTKPKPDECRACGREDGHYLGCPNTPRPDGPAPRAYRGRKTLTEEKENVDG